MIPKIIHYFWFGPKKMPPIVLKCIESWKKYFPDYEIKFWNEQNFDVNIIPYTRDAYTAGKYAFVSDYARFWVLYNEGGVYFDTDVEVIKPMDDLIEKGAFMGFERLTNIGVSYMVAPGLVCACEKGNTFIGHLINIYNDMKFELREDGTYKTIVMITNEELEARGMASDNTLQNVAGFTIYPHDYFDPRDFFDAKNVVLTSNTRSIHHYAASWMKTSDRIKHRLRSVLGDALFNMLRAVKHLLS